MIQKHCYECGAELTEKEKELVKTLDFTGEV